MRIAARGHRRRLALAFLVAGVPCLVLLILGSRMLDQERELLENRERERRERFASAVADRVRARLDRIRLELSAGMVPHPAPVLIARREGASLRLPWTYASSFAPWPQSPRVRAAIARGEQAELIEGDARAAASHYRAALRASDDVAEREFARLLLARALQTAGATGEALDHYRTIAEVPFTVRDDQGIPLALYALERLAATGSDGVAPLARRQLGTSVELSPAALHLASDFAARLDDQDLIGIVTARLARVERGAQLQRDIQAVLPAGPREDRWVLYGDGSWLVGDARVGAEASVVAIAVDELLATLTADEPSLHGLGFLREWSGEGYVSRAALPGLALHLPPMPPEAPEGAERRNFAFAALGFVALTSLIASGLLLRDVRREAETAELRSQFVSSVSHELKTPLSAIRMFAESLQMNRPAAASQREEYLQVILNESERLSRLLENVLEFSKIERGERRYRLEPRDLGEVVRGALRAAEYPLEQKGFHLAVHIEENLPPVRIDADAVEQALLNLLANAIKYSGDARELEVRVERAADSVALRVTDRGIGIPLQERAKIFEKFYRASNSEQATGAGLGLAIVAHIVRAHGGRLDVESRLGEGSRFTIAFPPEGA